MHHAYLYYGSLSNLSTLAEAARNLFDFKKQNNPDVQVQEYEKFGIEEARDLRISAQLKSSSGRALFVIGVGAITTEAQQALLKLFEEPQEGLIFVLLAPHGAIIPTLRSRFLAYPGAAVNERGRASLTRPGLGERFLSQAQKARSEEITKMLKDEEGLRERVRDFLSALEGTLHTALLKSKGKKELREGLEDIAKVRSYTNDRSPSLKMLLEHLAMSLPRFDLKTGLSKVEP